MRIFKRANLLKLARFSQDVYSYTVSCVIFFNNLQSVCVKLHTCIHILNDYCHHVYVYLQWLAKVFVHLKNCLVKRMYPGIGLEY